MSEAMQTPLQELLRQRAKLIENPEDCKWSATPVAELLIEASNKIAELEAQVTKLEAQLAEAERNAKVGAWVGGQHCNSLCSICSHEAQKLQLKPGNLGPCLVCDNGRFFILREK